MDIKERIKYLRKLHNLTQEGLAHSLGLNNKSSIANYESGYSSPSDDVKLKMCEIFNCSLDYLLGKSDYINENEYLTQKKISNMNLQKKVQFLLSDMTKKDIDCMCLIPIYSKIVLNNNKLDEKYVKGFVPISPDLFNIEDNDKCLFLQVNDDSLNKVIKKESYVLIKEQHTLQNGDIGLVVLNENNVILRRFNKINKQFITLEPVSNDCSILSVSVDLYKKQFKILGKVIGQFGNI